MKNLVFFLGFALGLYLILHFLKMRSAPEEACSPTTTQSADFYKENPSEGWRKTDIQDALMYYNQNFAPEEYDPLEKLCDRKCRISTMMSSDCFANKYNYCTLGNYEMSPNNRFDSCQGRCRFDEKQSKSNCCLW
jgi:hypothetical protein